MNPLSCFYSIVLLLVFCTLLFTKLTPTHTKRLPLLALTTPDIAVHISHAYGYSWPQRLIEGKQKKLKQPVHRRDCAHKRHTSCCSSFPVINHLMAEKREDSAWPYTQTLGLTAIRRGFFLSRLPLRVCSGGGPPEGNPVWAPWCFIPTSTSWPLLCAMTLAGRCRGAS